MARKPSKADLAKLENASHEQAQKWTNEQLSKGVSPKELRAVAQSHDRRRNGNTSAVDAIRNITG